MMAKELEYDDYPGVSNLYTPWKQRKGGELISP